MKKLNTTEMKVLSDRIYKDLQQRVQDAQKEQNELSDKENHKDAQTVVRRLKNLNGPTRAYLDGKLGKDSIENLDEDLVLQSMRVSQTKIKNLSWNTKQEIYDSLVIGQIDCPDLDSLVNKVTRQFVNRK
jgi:hypothetical protein